MISISSRCVFRLSKNAFSSRQCAHVSRTNTDTGTGTFMRAEAKPESKTIATIDGINNENFFTERLYHTKTASRDNKQTGQQANRQQANGYLKPCMLQIRRSLENQWLLRAPFRPLFFFI